MPFPTALPASRIPPAMDAPALRRGMDLGRTEPPCRPLDDTLATMATLAADRNAFGIDCAAAGLAA